MNLGKALAALFNLKHLTRVPVASVPSSVKPEALNRAQRRARGFYRRGHKLTVW